MSDVYAGSVRVSCKELVVEHDANMNITKILD